MEVAAVLRRMDESFHNRWTAADIVPLAARLTLFLDNRPDSAYWLLAMEVYCINGDVWQPDTLVEIAQGDRDAGEEDEEEDKVAEGQEQANKEDAEAEENNSDIGDYAVDRSDNPGPFTDGIIPYVHIDAETEEPRFVSPTSTYLFIRQQRVDIEHNRRWYDERGVQLPPSVTDMSKPQVPVEFLYAALLRDHRHAMMNTDAELLQDIPRHSSGCQIKLPRLSRLTKLLQLDDWYHGELETNTGQQGGWRASAVPTFVSLACCIVERTAAPYTRAAGELQVGNMSAFPRWHRAWLAWSTHAASNS